MKYPVFVSVVVYTRGESADIRPFLLHTSAVLCERFAAGEIIIVVDCEIGSAEEARRCGEELDVPLTVVELSRRHGVEAGIVAGLERALGDFVVEIETAGEKLPGDLLEQMYLTTAGGYDIVAVGSARESLRSRAFYAVVNRYSNLDYELRGEKLRLVSRRALNAMLGLNENVRYRKALYALTGYRHVRIEPEWANRSRRPINRESITLAIDIVISMSRLGVQVALWLSLTFSLLSLVAVGYTVANYLLNRNVAEGWTTLMTLVAGGFAGVFFVLGILGEYLARVLIEVRNRPTYTASSVTYHVPMDFEDESDRSLREIGPFVRRSHEPEP